MSFQTKEQIITEYLQSIDFNGDWNYKKIQRDLHNKLGEEPAINIKYIKDVVLNELNSEATEIKRIDTIDVIFSPNLDRKFKKLSFKLGA